MSLRVRILSLCPLLLAAGACQSLQQVSLHGSAEPVEAMLVAARACGIDNLQVRRARPFEPDRNTYVHMPRVTKRSWDCLMQWRRTHPEYALTETIIMR